jgi:CubicO group peptidase (beta-lactamase class C family)
MRDAGVGQALELVLGDGGIAQLCVLRHGQVVLDRQVGCTAQELFWLFSASKPFIAAQVHLLAGRGAISLDDPVPRTGRNMAARARTALRSGTS